MGVGWKGEKCVLGDFVLDLRWGKVFNSVTKGHKAWMKR